MAFIASLGISWLLGGGIVLALVIYFLFFRR